MQFDGSMPEVPALAASSDAEFWSTPPGTGKTHLSIGLAIKAAHTRHRIAFATAVDWVAHSKPPTTPADYRLSWRSCAASDCSSSTKSDTSDLLNIF